ncbi:outer membrane beta-barrel protein [Carboxylicivirga linearis]|uniref:Outer membrane beta-barrel protein n=1 Tax=Carboxylicivirga linearis TaxID=1628157 RepID=A0ABS5JZG0_9BACT|nr:outer membrane beta-barrel protein [Carboxylicivirga linearis]MBS2100243.1 outer membrane beta-barrel protein [Carboxylicivirga linearis]
MLDLGNNIDATFRNGLDKLEVKPSADVWKGIDSRLNHKENKRSIVVIWGMVGAASVVAAVLTSILLFQPNSVTELGLSTSVVEVEKNNRYDEEADVNTDESVMAFEEKSELVIEKEEINKMMIKGEQDIFLAQNEDSYMAEDDEERTEAISLEKKLSLLKGKGIYGLANNSSVSATKLKSTTKKEYYPLYAYNENSESKKDFQVLVGGALSSAYNYRNTSGAPVRSYDNYSESGFNSMGGGINVRIETSKRWSVETGVVYAQVGQEISRSANYQSDLMYGDALIRTSVELPRTYTNSMGKIRFSNSSQAPNASLGYESVNAIYDASLLSDGDGIRQSLEYIEVPLMARYKLLDGIAIVSLAGGFSSNILVGNTAYMLDGNSKMDIGETEGIKPVSWSSSLGLGFEIPVTKIIRIGVEPRFKYYLESISEISDYNFQPYSFSVFGGITFLL